MASAATGAAHPGHRHDSPAAVVDIITHEQLTDLRALQRTFDGAYARTALGQLSYAIVILRLFDRTFYWCGLVYTILAAQLIVVAVYRYNLALSNQDRWNDVRLGSMTPRGETASPSRSSAGPRRSSDSSSEQQHSQAILHGLPIFRRTFRTAGTVVAFTTACTFVLLVALAALVLKT